MLGCWVDCLIDQATDGPSDILIDEKKQWVAGLDLKHSKLFILIFAKNFARNFEKNNTWNIRRLVNETHRPSDPAYYIEDCRIFGPRIKIL